MFNVGVYLKFRYGEDWPAHFDKYNQKLLETPLGHQEINALVKSVNKRDYFYTCEKEPIVNICNKTVCGTKEFGLQAGNEDPPCLPTGIQKLLYDPPRWIVLVGDKNIETDTMTLIDQKKYLRLIMEKLNMFPPAAKPNVWRRHIDQLLRSVEEVEVPDDASDFGYFQFLLEQFCNGKRKARDKDEISLGRVWENGTRTYFRSADLTKFLEANNMRVNGRQIWSWLRKLDAGHKQMHIKGTTMQVWWIPTPEEPSDDEYPTILEDSTNEF